MPEPHSDTASNHTASAAKAAERADNGEHRSFQENQRQPPRAGNGAPAAMAATREIVDAGRGLAAVGRQAAFAGADLWSHSVEPIYAMQMEMLRWFDGLWRETSSAMRHSQPSRALSFAPFAGLPPADVTETSKAYMLSIELPGLSKEDVDLAVEGDWLTVTGHKAETRDDVSASYRLSERRFGRFERTFPLPPDVQRERLDATFKDGVLKVMLPRDAEQTLRSKVQIRT